MDVPAVNKGGTASMTPFASENWQRAFLLCGRDGEPPTKERCLPGKGKRGQAGPEKRKQTSRARKGADHEQGAGEDL